MMQNIILILKLIIFFSLVRWQTHNLPATVEMIRVVLDERAEAFLMFLKFRKFHFLMFYWKHKKFIDAVEHDYALLSEYFSHITYVTITVVATKLIKSCFHPLSFISMLMFLNYITMPFTISWELFLDYFYPLPGLNWEERVLENPEYFVKEDTLAPPLSKEEEETLNKAFQNLKLNSLETPEGKKLQEEKIAEEKEKAFRDKFHTYNLFTAYLVFNFATVIILKILQARRED